MGCLWLCLVLVFAHQTHSDTDIKETWGPGFLEMCSYPESYHSAQPGLNCYLQRIGVFEWARLEVRSHRPLLVQFHRFVNAKESKRIIAFAHTKELYAQKVVESGHSFTHKGRRANGTWIMHRNEDDNIALLFGRAQRMLKLNISIAEQWLVLMYEPKGHYAPHYDHLPVHPDPDKRDWWMSNYGNRIATLLLILEAAEEGGATVFPLLGRMGVTVQPNAGDALFWFNADATDTKERSSLHGACPITAGRKVAATLWIRTVGQELLQLCPTGNDRSYSFAHAFS